MYVHKGLGREPIYDDRGSRNIEPSIISTPPVAPDPVLPYTQDVVSTRPFDMERRNISEALLLVEELNEKQLEHLIVEREDLSPRVKKVFTIGLKKKRGLVPVTTPLVEPTFVADSSVTNLDVVRQAGFIPEIGNNAGLISAVVIGLAFMFFGNSKSKKKQIGF